MQAVNVPGGTLLPSVRNGALGGADQATAVLRLAAGPGAVLDSTATFGAIPRNTTAVAADGMSFAGADSNLTRFTVLLETSTRMDR